ncbi:hypothetical protein AAG570_011002 [Ranatra chinensis]|uniref:Uncharacterized protein n=1 Tax=Ranatra chinensis TaxID=642074 RepID=A0ABD0YJE1_9HEMI
MAPEHVREEHQAGDYQEVLTDQSDAAKGTLRFLHERSGDRVLVNGVDPGAGDCNGFVVASGDASALGGLLESIPLKAARIERVVAFSYWGNSSGFLLQSQRRVFGYTEALLAVNIGQRPEYYQLELSDISFRRLPGGLKGKWPRMTHGIENFHGKEFKVATFNCSLFSSIGPFDSYGNPRWIAGSDMRLIHEVSRILNFTYKVVLPAEETLKSGRGNKAYIEDIMGQLKTGGADIAACGLWMTSDRINSDVHMTTALSAITIEVLVPRQQPVQISYSVVFVFQYTVWCLILALVLITSVCLWLIAMYYKKKRKPTGKCKSF